MRGKKAVFLTLILLATLLHFPLAIGDPGWLDGWGYRKSLTIIGSIDGAQTDYQIGVFVYQDTGTDGNLTRGNTVFGKVYCNSSQDNFGDIRFTKADGTTELYYWPEYNSSGDYAIFWVEIDSIPESPSTVDIYVYYGTAGATATTSSMADTWTDSLDWASDLTGQFTKYEPVADPDYEDDWLTSTLAEYPCRVIVKRAITNSWTSHLYGILTNIILNKDANDLRDSVEAGISRISDDTNHGADGNTVGYFLQDLPASSDIGTFDFVLETYFINDILVVAETSMKGEIMPNGRGSVLEELGFADAPDSLNYWGYGYGSGSNIIGETWEYDADEDVIIYGCGLSEGGDHQEKSPWMVIGKYTTNEPTFGDWGTEEEAPTLEAPAQAMGKYYALAIILLILGILIGIGIGRRR